MFMNYSNTQNTKYEKKKKEEEEEKKNMTCDVMFDFQTDHPKV